MKKISLFLFALIATSAVMAQIKLTGKVQNADGKAVEGASVVYKKNGHGVTTDATGSYSIEVESLPADLEISLIGYATQLLTANNANVVLVKLEQTGKTLDDVVVVGYGTQKKVNLTGAVSSVKMDDVLGDRPISTTTQALQGAIPGLQITSSTGQPGASSSLQIRGINSLNGGSPLVLVDNVPMSIDDVNPRDIESVSVLKDAAAASIYGGRAAFGVILITTKKGKRNQPIKFNYTANITTSKPANLPEKASIRQTIQAFRDWGNIQTWTSQNLNVWDSLLTDYNSNPSKYPENEAVVGGVIYRLKEDDLLKKFMTNSFEQIHNLSFSGGSEKSNYRVSLGYSNEDGIMVTNKDSYQKFNVNAYLNTELAKNLNASINIFYKNDNRSTPANMAILFGNGIGFPDYANSGFYTTPDGRIVPFNTPNNILKTEPAIKAFGDDVRLFGKLEYAPAKWFKIAGEYTFDKSADNTRQFTAINEYMNTQTYNLQNLNNTSSYYRYNGVTNYQALNLYSTLSHAFDNHNLSLMLGTNQEMSKFESFSTSVQDILSPDVPSLSTGTGTRNNSDAFSEFAISGYFARLNYNYKDKYLFEANGRYDGSSRFPPGNRFGFFPSFSAGWVISEEDFMQGIHSQLPLLKLRASWGEIGNQVVGNNYPYIPGMETYNSPWVDASSNLRSVSINPPALVSASFSWETVRTADVGIDLGLFRNRLTTSFDLFKRQTLGMLRQGAQLPGVLGTTAPLQNTADLESKGWELEMAWNQRGKKFNWTLGFNLSDNTGTITRYGNDAGLLSDYYVGYKIGQIWGFETAGFFTVDDFEKGSLNSNLMGGKLLSNVAPYKGVPQNPGDIRYVDLNGDGVIFTGNNTVSDPGDRKIIGNSNRRYQYGINGSASYMNFDLSVFIQGIGKRDIWISNQLYWPYNTEFESVYTHQLDYWTPENTNAFYPRSYANASGNTGTSRNVQTKYLSNGAYLRIKNIELGYSIPSSVLNHIKMDKIRLFFSGENLFTFDHLPDGIDPEIANINRGGGYPFIKKFSFGVNVSF